MITGVAFCPQAPALVPQVGRGLDGELGALRAACRTAIRRVAAPGVTVTVVGSAEHASSHGRTSRGSFAGLGVDHVVSLGPDADGPLELPTSLTVGAWLVQDALGPDTTARGYAVAAPGDLTPFEGSTALVVVGDGSARRTDKAPGYLDDRAGSVDRSIAAALAAGDGAGLRALDPAVARDLLVAGAPAWCAVATHLEPYEWDAELLYDDAPYGVGYFAAAWTRRA